MARRTSGTCELYPQPVCTRIQMYAARDSASSCNSRPRSHICPFSASWSRSIDLAPEQRRLRGNRRAMLPHSQLTWSSGVRKPTNKGFRIPGNRLNGHLPGMAGLLSLRVRHSGEAYSSTPHRALKAERLHPLPRLAVAARHTTREPLFRYHNLRCWFFAPLTPAAQQPAYE